MDIHNVSRRSALAALAAMTTVAACPTAHKPIHPSLCG